MRQIKIRDLKLQIIGNSVGFIIPKAFTDKGLLTLYKKYNVLLVEVEDVTA